MIASLLYFLATRSSHGNQWRWQPVIGLIVASAFTLPVDAEEPREANARPVAAAATTDGDRAAAGPPRDPQTQVDRRSQAVVKHPPAEGGRGEPRRMLRRRAGRVGHETGRTAPGSDRPATPWYRTGLGSLGIVLAILGGVCLCARKWIPAVRMAESQAMQVVARASVSPKQSVALVRLGRRFVMVGVSPDRMSVLSEISDREEVAHLARVTGTSGESVRPGFEEWLAEESKEFGTDVEDESGAQPDPIRVVGSDNGSALTDLLDRLRKLHAKSEPPPATGTRRTAARGSF
ncbi:MAG: FliO/MopB family protein [Phycisphaerae bacterium]